MISKGTVSAVESLVSPFKGFGGLFYGIREYTQGDSLRLIHWPKTAHENKLMIKEYEEAASSYFSVLILENRKQYLSRDEELFERSVDHLASMAKYFMDNRQPSMLVTTSGKAVVFKEGITPSENFEMIIDFLTTVTAESLSEDIIIKGISHFFKMNTFCYYFLPQRKTLPPIEKTLPVDIEYFFIVQSSDSTSYAEIEKYPDGIHAGKIILE